VTVDSRSRPPRARALPRYFPDVTDRSQPADPLPIQHRISESAVEDGFIQALMVNAPVRLQPESDAVWT
jgi:hypothetical protein